jgi:hypothetical protein
VYQVCADAQDDQPFRVGHTLGIGLGVTQVGAVTVDSLVDLACSAVLYEDGLSTPLDGGGGACSNAGQINFHCRQSQHIRSG